MERVRIRSLLNNFKYHQKSLSAPKQASTEACSTFTQPRQPSLFQNQSIIAHQGYFLIQPLTSYDERKSKSKSILQARRNFYSTSKQTGKKKTKISNKSYMINLSHKNKVEQNPKQLGIRTKKINVRSTKSNDKFIQIDKQYLRKMQQIENQGMIQLQKIQPKIENQQLRPQLKKTVIETYRQKYQNKNAKPLTILLPTDKKQIKALSFQRNPQINEIKFRNLIRRDSAICPWDLQSPSPF